MTDCLGTVVASDRCVRSGLQEMLVALYDSHLLPRALEMTADISWTVQSTPFHSCQHMAQGNLYAISYSQMCLYAMMQMLPKPFRYLFSCGIHAQHNFDGDDELLNESAQLHLATSWQTSRGQKSTYKSCVQNTSR